ncbi:hypothetical protein BDR03DRAFT_967509 [Suillus americanus]|nr:hypothetical protein BDR03DRAFT_967509 [Suillus americanus]
MVVSHTSSPYLGAYDRISQWLAAVTLYMTVLSVNAWQIPWFMPGSVIFNCSPRAC